MYTLTNVYNFVSHSPRAISRAESFVGYIGLDQVSQEDDDTLVSNRVVPLFCVTTITASLKRAECPTHPKVSFMSHFCLE